MKLEKETSFDKISETFSKRNALILDYISQILVYGSDTKGVISLDKHQFDDGEYLIMTVSVIKNRYFRWHDLGIKSTESKKFYDYIFQSVIQKFKTFSLSISGNALIIQSDVNHNVVEVQFSLDKKIEKDWFDKIKCQI